MASPFHSSARWQKLRNAYLIEHPLCVYCRRQGRYTAATVVDHIVPVRQDPDKAVDVSNLQSLCELHHNSAKAIEEASGKVVGCDVNGMPIDDEHPWSNT